MSRLTVLWNQRSRPLSVSSTQSSTLSPWGLGMGRPFPAAVPMTTLTRERFAGAGEAAGDLEAGGVDGGHEEGALGRHVVIRQPEGLLHDLGHHGRRRAVAQHLLHHLPRVRHAVQHLPPYLLLGVWPHLRLLLPHLQAAASSGRPPLELIPSPWNRLRARTTATCTASNGQGLHTGMHASFV